MDHNHVGDIYMCADGEEQSISLSMRLGKEGEERYNVAS